LGRGVRRALERVGSDPAALGRAQRRESLGLRRSTRAATAPGRSARRAWSTISRRASTSR
jgi:hypothetical protein